MGFSTGTKYPGSDGSPVANGSHTVIIDQVTMKVGKGRQTSGATQLDVRMRLFDEADPDCGRVVFESYFCVLTAWGFGRLVQLFQAINPAGKGIDDDPEGLDPESAQSVADHLVGLPFVVETKIERSTYEGQEREKARPRRYRRISAKEEERLQSLFGDLLAPSWEEYEGAGVFDERAEGGGSNAGAGGSNFADDEIPF